MIGAGTKLGRYEIRSKIGAGGMGEVYLAEDTKLRRKVALKLLSRDLTRKPDRLRRFEQEAQAASALNHPNIIVIYEIGIEGDIHFIATEFIEGETLHQHMHRTRMSIRESLDIATQVASALSAAHQAGIIHRDIKPENVMIRPDGYVKVLDFGLAKLTEQQTTSTDTEAPTIARASTDPGTVMGTINYMSPEQARGKPVDARSDIFSLGVVIYEMIAGRAPFEAETPSDVMSFILHKEPPPMARYSPDVSAELERIVTKSLAKDKDERYQTAKDLLIDLKRLKQKQEIEAELERSVSPDTISGGPSVATSSGTAAATAMDSAGRGGEAAIRTASSAEYIVTGIKRHKIAALSVVLITAAAIVGVISYLHARNTEVAIESIAVLPFDNQSRDPDTDYLSDGITESIINRLTRIQDLRVIARSTVFRYKGKETDPIAIGKGLGVRAVLAGRLLRRGDQLTASAELIDVRDNKQIWGEQYTRKVADALAVQQEISREIAERLRPTLTGEQRRQLTTGDTANAQAYQSYLRGRYYWNKRTAEGVKKAIEQFQQAIDSDPNYALGYVGLADCYIILEEYAGVPSRETLPKARAAADRALQLDDALAEAHTSSAFIYNQQWRWAEAEQEFRRAISLNPNYATTHHWFSVYLRNRRRFDEAQREIMRAQELDPLSPIIAANVANLYLLNDDVDSSIEQGKKLIELEPSFGPSYLGQAYLKQRRYEEAIAAFKRTAELSGRASGDLGELGNAYAVAGGRAEALAIVKELEARYSKREATGQNVAWVYAGLGDRDRTFEWLEKDFQQRSGLLPQIAWQFAFDSLRSDPRYADLLRRMGLEP